MAKMRWNCIAEVLKNRNHKVGAEVGVWTGKFTYNILTLLPDIKTYYAIDAWKMYGDYKNSLKSDTFIKADYDNIFKTYKNQVKKFKNKIITLRMMSDEALNKIPDLSLDFIFIDANHSYEYAKQDITNWSTKVKINGLISGHDYGRNTYSDKGVTKAVDELIPSVNKGYNGVWYTFKDSNGFK